MQKLQFELCGNVKAPHRGTKGSAGIDFFVPNNQEQGRERGYIVKPHGSINIPSGVKAKIPEGYALIAFNKSGVALNKNLQVGACVVDSDYEGEIHLHLFNLSNSEYAHIEYGEKLVQFLLVPVSHYNFSIVKEIKRKLKSVRGSKGFGSTGKK